MTADRNTDPTRKSLSFRPRLHDPWEDAWVMASGRARHARAVADEAGRILKAGGRLITVREIIAHELDKKRPATRDRKVWLSGELDALKLLFDGAKADTKAFFDVPLTAIVGLNHKNTNTSGEDWKALFSGLTAADWTLAELRYLESEIGLNLFRSPTASKTLDLSAYGGAVVATNGYHRLVAAVCWLSARYGDDTPLRKGSVTVYTLAPEVRTLLAGAWRRSENVEVAAAVSENGLPPDPDVQCLLAMRDTHGHRVGTWKVIDGRPHPVVAKKPGLARYLPTPAGHVERGEARPDWKPLQDPVLAALVNDGWLNEQRYEPWTEPGIDQQRAETAAYEIAINARAQDDSPSP